MSKQYLACKDQTEAFAQKLENQALSKDNLNGRINELRFILDQYKEELRDYGVDPDIELQKLI